MLYKNLRGMRLTWLCVLAMASLVMAGTTGKIAGRVVDKTSSEALVAANVLVEGTTVGAASDLNGNFTILNVPPGVYRLRATIIGYAALTIEDVHVRIDQTSEVNFELTQEALAGEEVIVVAERKLVEADVSASVAAITSQEVQVLPRTTIAEAVQLQAGVEDNLTIRGGGADEVLFLVDGFAMRDARNNQPVTGIALSAIQELSLVRGGFNAEYGQVRSGIVNVVTKEGNKSQYAGSITARYSDPGRKHFGISPFDPNSMWLRPYLDPGVAFVGTSNGSWDIYTQNQHPLFEGWDQVARARNTNTNPNDDLSPAAAQRLFQWQHRRQEITDQPDYNIDAGLGGPVPLIGGRLGDLRFFTSYRSTREMLVIPLTRDDYFDYDWNLKVTSDLNPTMKLDLIGLMGKSYNVAVNGLEQDNSTDYIRSPINIADQVSNFPFTTSSRIFSNSYYSLAEVEHRGLSANLTHVLGPKTFYDFRLDYFQRQYDTKPRDLRDASTFELIPGSDIFVDEAPLGWSPGADVGLGDGLLFGGHTSTARDNSKSSLFKAKLDLTSQVNFHNQIKAGFEFVHNTLDLDYAILNIPFPEGNVFVKETWNPILASLYLQDKIEFKSLIANLGVRMDYSNANAEWVRAGKYDASYLSAAYNPNAEYPMESAEAKVSLSPRLGISHPISVKSKLFFNYGHFKQLPTYEELFEISRGPSGKLNSFGDPNLNLAKTISYELGYDHEVFQDYLIQVAGFYHDITDQVAYTARESIDGSVSVNVATNDSYEDIRALELTLKKARGEWWSGFFAYTYQVTTSGRFGRDQEYENPQDQREFDNDNGNFDQNRPLPQPKANLVLTFHTPNNSRHEIMGINWLSNWSTTFLGTYRADLYETWNPNQVPYVSQNLHRTSYYSLDLRLSRAFEVGPMKLTFFMDVSNLFNTKTFSFASFYNSFDRIDYFESLHLPPSNAYHNIPGDDRPGDFRSEGVSFVPIELIASQDRLPANGLPPNAGFLEADRRVLFYARDSGQYWEFRNGSWGQADQGFVDQVLKDKAYIDMPNQTTFTFLNPRNIFFGITTSFEF